MRGFKKTLKTNGLIIIIFLLAIVMIVPSSATTQNYYYKYNFTGAIGLPDTNTVLFVMDEYDDATDELTGKKIYAYCADQSTPMVPGVKYRISRNASDQLRAILKNTSPKVTRADLTNNVNDSWVAEAMGSINTILSTSRAVTGSQFAIWHFTNDFNDSISDGDVNKLYQYLINLPEESEADYAPVDISVTSTGFDSEHNLIVHFTYTNIFDTITLSKSFDGVEIDYQEGAGTIFIPSSSLGETIEFSIIVSANRSVNDAYILSVSGEEVSQELVAFADNNINVSAKTDILITPTPPVQLEGVQTAWAYGGDHAIAFNGIANGNNWGWTNGPLTEGSYEFDLYAGAGQNDLDKGTLVGKLNVEYHNGKVSAGYTMLPGYEMKEAHLFIGNDYLPKNGKNYKHSPGKFPYEGKFETAVTSHEFGEYSITGDIYIAAHAVVSNKK